MQACVGVCLRPIARANVCLRLQARGPRRPAKDRQAESRQTKEFRTRRRRNPYRSWKRVTGAQIFACLAETRPLAVRAPPGSVRRRDQRGCRCPAAWRAQTAADVVRRNSRSVTSKSCQRTTPVSATSLPWAAMQAGIISAKSGLVRSPTKASVVPRPSESSLHHRRMCRRCRGCSRDRRRYQPAYALARCIEPET